MAIGQIPPWLDVNPSQFVRAGQEGAEAGLGVARLRQSAQSDAARLGLEADALAQKAQSDAAHLSQQEHIAQMEMQARKEIAEQNRLREDQQMLIQNAYHQAEIGLGKARIDQQRALADEKAKEAAMTFAQESALAQHIAAGGDLATGLMKFPRGKGLARALNPAQDYEGPTRTEEIEGGTVISRPGSSHWQYVPKPKTAAVKLTPAETAQAGLIKSQAKRLDSSIGKLTDAVDKLSKDELETDAGKSKVAKLEAKRREFNEAKSALDMIYNKPKLMPVMGAKQMAERDVAMPKSKVERARELKAEHPDWSREKIIDAVKQEFSEQESR